MAYRKIAADRLFTGHELLGSDAVLVVEDDGQVVDVLRNDAPDDVERFSGILCPGFVNCHCHLELSHLKDLMPTGVGMIPFLQTVMNKRSYAATVIAEAIAAQEKYMWRNGISAVGDICNTSDTISVKSSSLIRFHNFVEVAGFIPSTANNRFQRAVELYESFSSHQLPASIVPHAPYSVSDELMKMINTHEPSAVLTIHNQESADEEEFFLRGTGGFSRLFSDMNVDISSWRPPARSSLQHVLEQISREHSLILVHNVHTQEQHFRWIYDQGSQLPQIWWCLCPNANIYINGQLPDVDLIAGNSEKIVVGTDSLASNEQLDVLEELKTLQIHFPNISLAKMLSWATLNGAEALRIGESFGSFEKGKRPGVINITHAFDTLSNKSRAERIL